jgi:hypothetical protein
MDLHALTDADSFNAFSLLCLNAAGQYVEPRDDLTEFRDGREIKPNEVPGYLKDRVRLPAGTTDVFVWVHGWRNSHASALGNVRRLFSAISQVKQARSAAYPRLDSFVPAYVAVRWPSMSRPLPGGYKRIRDRATALTEEGDAAFFLASLLGYMDVKNTRAGGPGSKTLIARGGFLVHCLGHSFGGRFLTAAIQAAADPQPRVRRLLVELARPARKVLSASNTRNGFEFTVDSLLVFQMAAPRTRFGAQLAALLEHAPLRGPVVLTYSSHDRANCLWHRVMEGEQGIGCSGAAEPRHEIGKAKLRGLISRYTNADFARRIVNIQASNAFRKGGGLAHPEGAHSDFLYEESVHLILSLADSVRG